MGFYCIFYTFLLTIYVISCLGCTKFYSIIFFNFSWSLIFKAEEFKWIQLK